MDWDFYRDEVKRGNKIPNHKPKTVAAGEAFGELTALSGGSSNQRIRTLCSCGSTFAATAASLVTHCTVLCSLCYDKKFNKRWTPSEKWINPKPLPIEDRHRVKLWRPVNRRGLIDDTDDRDLPRNALLMSVDATMQGIDHPLFDELEYDSCKPEKVDDVMRVANWLIDSRNRSESIWHELAFRTVQIDQKIAKHCLRDRPEKGTLTTREWEAIVYVWNYRCAYCGHCPRVLHIEHVVPISRNGTTTIGNIVPACRECNMRKLANWLDDFIGAKHAAEFRESHKSRIDQVQRLLSGKTRKKGRQKKPVIIQPGQRVIPGSEYHSSAATYDVIIGARFGELTARSSGSNMSQIKTLCSCGNESRVIAARLISGKVKRCAKCEDVLDTSWKHPENWSSPKPMTADTRNAEIAKARAERKQADFERRYRRCPTTVSTVSVPTGSA